MILPGTGRGTHHPHVPPIVETARRLRRQMSYPEVLLWQRLRRSPMGIRFRKQHPLGLDYVADFYCASAKMVIEVDGLIHEQPGVMAHDEVRDEFIKLRNLSLVRVPAQDILRNANETAAAIVALASRGGPPPPPPPRRPPPPPPPAAGGAPVPLPSKLGRIKGRTMDFISILSVFVLACFVGYYVVWSVTPALHTPLMAVTNAISSVIIVGALIASAAAGSAVAKWLGLAAVTLASVNIFGGFAVTARMLAMYQKKR